MLFSLWTWLVETIMKGLYKIWKILWDIYKFDLYMTQKVTYPEIMHNIHTKKSHKSLKLLWMFNDKNCAHSFYFWVYSTESKRFPCGYFTDSFTLASRYYWSPSDAVICRFSIKYMFLKTFRNSQEINHY